MLQIVERVRFEGDQTTLVALFHSLQLINKLTFNSSNKYTTNQKHLEAFLQNNFAYKKGLQYEDVKNVDKALSDIRQQYQKTADKAKQKVLTIIDDTIVYLNSFKEQLEKTDIRKKEDDNK